MQRKPRDPIPGTAHRVLALLALLTPGPACRTAICRAAAPIRGPMPRAHRRAGPSRAGPAGQSRQGPDALRFGGRPTKTGWPATPRPAVDRGPGRPGYAMALTFPRLKPQRPEPGWKTLLGAAMPWAAMGPLARCLGLALPDGT